MHTTLYLLTLNICLSNLPASYFSTVDVGSLPRYDQHKLSSLIPTMSHRLITFYALNYVNFYCIVKMQCLGRIVCKIITLFDAFSPEISSM